jgi:uncharacterized protein YqeY
MNLKNAIDQDLKTALLGGDQPLATTLRGLKAEILNIEIRDGKRAEGLNVDEVIAVLQKEAKKRQESADLYRQGGDEHREAKELAEKEIIAQYLPAQLSETEVQALIDEVVAATGASGMQAMGQVIGAVKAKAGASADGAMVARLVKEKLAQ